MCLSELTNEKVKGFPLVSFVMTSDEISDFRQKLKSVPPEFFVWILMGGRVALPLWRKPSVRTS